MLAGLIIVSGVCEWLGYRALLKCPIDVTFPELQSAGTEAGRRLRFIRLELKGTPTHLPTMEQTRDFVHKTLPLAESIVFERCSDTDWEMEKSGRWNISDPLIDCIRPYQPSSTTADPSIPAIPISKDHNAVKITIFVLVGISPVIGCLCVCCFSFRKSIGNRIQGIFMRNTNLVIANRNNLGAQ